MEWNDDYCEKDVSFTATINNFTITDGTGQYACVVTRRKTRFVRLKVDFKSTQILVVSDTLRKSLFKAFCLRICISTYTTNF